MRVAGSEGRACAYSHAIIIPYIMYAHTYIYKDGFSKKLHHGRLKFQAVSNG